MKYEDFIKSKVLQSGTYGFDAMVENETLFPFQQECVRWTLKKGRAALFQGCGVGKTAQQLTWADIVCRHTNGNTLILAPLAVSKQTVREGRKFGVDVNLCRKQDDVRPGVNITNYEMVDHFDAGAFVAVVMDECFPAGTLIDMADGSKKTIEQVKTGEEIFNANGKDIVSGTYKRRINRAIRVHVGGKRITCSENHPFFTLHGWRSAQDLQPGDYILETTEAVRILRGNSSSEACQPKDEKILQSILFSEMADDAAGCFGGGTHGRNTRQDREEEVCMVQSWKPEGFKRDRASQESEPSIIAGSSEENQHDIASDGAQTFRAWGQWSRDDRAAIVSDGCSARELDCGITYITGKTDSRISDALQTRLGKRRDENRYRSGWELSLCEEGPRLKERCEIGGIRVDGIEVMESGHPELERFRDADGFVYFYDIKATRHPSFSVEGFLVHNSSILKCLTGKTRTKLIKKFSATPYRLCCTATPAPNDYTELGNHAEFLGLMSVQEMLSRWFINDAFNVGDWRLKKHAEQDFWRWVGTWAICMTRPSDIGYPDDGYNLPPLTTVRHILKQDMTDFEHGLLVKKSKPSATELRREMKKSLEDRCDKAAELAGGNEPVILWCNTNDEADALQSRIKDAQEVRGSMPADRKESILEDFATSNLRALITKPSIAGHGMNYQHCNRMIFVGLSYSFEERYQAVRRCWRFGQKREVFDHVVMGESEVSIFDTVKEKETRHLEMERAMAGSINQFSNDNGIRYREYVAEKSIILPNFLKRSAA